MQFFKTPNINFVSQMNKAFIFSGILILITFVSLIIHKGPNYSIDFIGGTMIQLSFEKPVVQDLAKIRTIITELNFGQPEVKTIGGKEDNEIQIIVEKQAEGTTVGDAIKATFKQKYGENPFVLRKEEKVGPKIGKELTRNTLLAILISLVALIIYIAARFHLPFGVGAIIALFHDVLITTGVFSVFNFEFSLPVVAAFLTIIGYSLNDTIVVFDRIRENMGGLSTKKNFKEKVNDSINETLSRTIITGLTTLVVLVILFVFFMQSGDVIMLFAIALIVGILIGTYSSVFIASPIVILWNKKWPIK